MKFVSFLIASLFIHISFSQNVGIVRKNYSSYVYDSLLMDYIETYDSSTVRLGSVDPYSGVVSNYSTNEYAIGINLNGATIDPYLNKYYIGSGTNLLTFDITTGNLDNSVPISGIIPTSAFQNYRFNPSDSTIYGMVPENFYSSYYDSLSMSYIEVLDSARIRFASINTITGQYNLIGNTPFKNIYTLAGNSIDPYQMIYYYSAVDTLVGIDLYDGSVFSEVQIQLPANGIFENIAYSCADTSIYGISRQNYTSIVYDSLFMDYIEVIDSTTFRLSKINPNTGAITFISPYNLQAGSNLTGGAYIDPNTMTYFFNHGIQIIGVSLTSGLITSSITKTYPSGEIALDMMRSTQNCYGALKMRENPILENEDILSDDNLHVYPNPSNSKITISTNSPLIFISIIDLTGKEVLKTKEKTLDISELSNGIYLVKCYFENNIVLARKLIKN
jgi:hypothetical protein